MQFHFLYLFFTWKIICQPQNSDQKKPPEGGGFIKIHNYDRLHHTPSGLRTVAAFAHVGVMVHIVFQFTLNISIPVNGKRIKQPCGCGYADETRANYRPGCQNAVMQFELLNTHGAARRGRLVFARGSVETPAFMPVGTYGTVKAMTPGAVLESGAEILLGNTFHLMLRPGTEVIQMHGGLHEFMQWQRPILTDSGGFQVWSLSERRKITEQGVTFASPVDGARVFLGPLQTSAEIRWPVPASRRTSRAGFLVTIWAII